MANIDLESAKPLGVNIPPGYSNYPAPGKIEELYDANVPGLYREASPYQDISSTGPVEFGPRQPFLYTYPDQSNDGINAAMKYSSQAFPVPSAERDIIRIGKFMATGNGITFLMKQFLLQGFQSYNETTLYNPAEVMLATTRPLTMGIMPRPIRHIDMSGGILGALASLIGMSFNNGNSAPAGTTGMGALPNSGQSDGKGLLRSRDALKAKGILETYWVGGNTFGGSITDRISDLASSIFPMFAGSRSQSPAQYRSDEGAYGMMLLDGNNRLAYNDSYGALKENTQFWFGGADGMRKNNETPRARNVLFASSFNYKSLTDRTFIDYGSNNLTGTVYGQEVGYSPQEKDGLNRYGDNVGIFKINGSGDTATYKYSDILMQYSVFTSNGVKFYVDRFNGQTTITGGTIDLGGVNNTGYLVVNNVDPNSPVKKYADSVGIKKDDETTQYSDILVDFSGYVSEAANKVSGSKFADSQNSKVKEIKDGLQKLLKNISADNVYTTNLPIDSSSRVLMTYNSAKLGYDSIYNTKNPKQDPMNYKLGYLSTYKDTTDRLIDNEIQGRKKTLKMATTNRFDGINILTVLGKDKLILDSMIDGWNVYKPYEDDLIAFFFYDVVNDKYIPFRATVKGINENNNAVWEDLKFIGRADTIFNYNGFTRLLNFSFHVVVNSIIELYPCWKRINYLASLVKPSNYTSKGDTKVYNRFMVPPMVMLTIGDLYKFQPIALSTVNVTIPEDATWETMTQSDGSSTEWSYLNQIIKFKDNSVPPQQGPALPSVSNAQLKAELTTAGRYPKRTDLYAQLPHEAEIGISCFILEKERAIAGGQQYSHSPITDINSTNAADFGQLEPGGTAYNVDPKKAYLQPPTEFAKKLRVALPTSQL